MDTGDDCSQARSIRGEESGFLVATYTQQLVSRQHLLEFSLMTTIVLVSRIRLDSVMEGTRVCVRMRVRPMNARMDGWTHGNAWVDLGVKCSRGRAGIGARVVRDGVLVEDGIFVDCTGAVFVVWPFDTVPPCSVSVLYGEPRG